MFKTIPLLAILLLASSCHKTIIPTHESFQEELKISEKCPDFGNCKLIVLRNKSLDTLHFNNALTYKLQESSDTDVIKFDYNIHLELSNSDGGYREELLFEIPKGNFKKTYSDTQLQQTKMLFGRYCFCRGKTGLFKISEGKLDIKVKAQKIVFNLNFKQNNVPQVFKKISVE